MKWLKRDADAVTGGQVASGQRAHTTGATLMALIVISGVILIGVGVWLLGVGRP